MVVAARAFASTPASSATAALPIRIINSAGVASTVLQLLMQSQGYLNTFGLDPTFLSVSDGNKIVSALIGGDADICVFSGFSQVLTAIEKGGALRVVAGSLVTPNHAVYAKNEAIRSAQDLRGKTIGVGPVGGLLHQIMIALLTAKGVDPKDVTFANIGGAGDVFRSVVAGNIDAGPADLARFDLKYGVHILSDGEIAQELPEFTFQASYTSSKAIADRREALVRTLAAYSHLYSFLNAPAAKDAYLAVSASQGPNALEEAQKEWDFIQTHHAYDPGLVLSEERVRYAQELNVASGSQKRVLDYSEIVDASIARDALVLAARG
jgi:NitT/TauT family transport system substrate-binding protein